MKTYITLLISLFYIITSTPASGQDNDFEFGIYETVSLNDIKPLTEKQSKSVLNQELKMDAPILAYLSINDKDYIDLLIKDHSSPHVNILPTKSFGGNNSLAIVSIRKEAAIVLDDIAKAVPSKKGIELRFNYKGARKFAKLTKENIGNMIAFVINDEIWSMPRVNAQIKGGVALITGINDQNIIKKTCELINTSK